MWCPLLFVPEGQTFLHTGGDKHFSHTRGGDKHFKLKAVVAMMMFIKRWMCGKRASSPRELEFSGARRALKF